jgi:hypothetical protein
MAIVTTRPKPSPPAFRPSAPQRPTAKEEPARNFGMVFSRRGADAIVSGEKTAALVGIATDPWAKRLRPGMTLRIKAWSHIPEKRDRGSVTIAGICTHRGIGDVPACSREHDPAALNPWVPQWAQILADAVSQGGKVTDPLAQRAAGATGWIVVEFSDPRRA